jgi:hypothetical protein
MATCFGTRDANSFVSMRKDRYAIVQRVPELRYKL